MAVTASNFSSLMTGFVGGFSSASSTITTTWTQPTTISIGNVELTEEVARKLVDLIEQLDRLSDPKELRALAAGVAQEADCTQKEARTTLTALRSLLDLAAIERKLEAV